MFYVDCCDSLHFEFYLHFTSDHQPAVNQAYIERPATPFAFAVWSTESAHTTRRRHAPKRREVHQQASFRNLMYFNVQNISNLNGIKYKRKSKDSRE